MTHHETSIKLLGPTEWSRLTSAAKKANRVESTWTRKLQDKIDSFEDLIVDAIIDGKPIEYLDVDFLDTIIDHAKDAYSAGLSVAENDIEAKSKGAPQKVIKMAGNKLPDPVSDPDKPRRKSWLPVSFAELRKWYDEVRRGKNVPASIKKNAEKIKTEYLKQCQSVWQKYAQSFRAGETFNQDQVRAMVRKAAQVPKRRAATIVATETTNYYNDVRENYYDKTGLVDHYLFISIRDQRTTKWCKDRSGLVYKADSEYFKTEKPACHYYCRSEITPLVVWNPAHRRLIENKSLARENNKCEPLPPGWGGSSKKQITRGKK